MTKETGLYCWILTLKESDVSRELIDDLRNIGFEVGIVLGKDARSEDLPEEWFDCERSHRLYGRNLSPGEIACTYGHFKIISEAVRKTDLKMGLVLEDDVTLVSINAVKTLIDSREFIGKTFWTFANQGVSVASKINRFFQLRALNHLFIPFGSFAYMFTRQSAHALFEGFSKFGASGYVADFPSFFPDYVKFRVVSELVFQHDYSHTSSISRYPETQRAYLRRLGGRFKTITFWQWITSGYRDSGIKGHFFMKVLRLLYVWIYKEHQEIFWIDNRTNE